MADDAAALQWRVRSLSVAVLHFCLSCSPSPDTKGIVTYQVYFSRLIIFIDVYGCMAEYMSVHFVYNAFRFKSARFPGTGIADYYKLQCS